jgi:hypothetical protein
MTFRDLFAGSRFHIVRLARNNNGALNSREGFQGRRKSSAEKQGFFYCFLSLGCDGRQIVVNASENANFNHTLENLPAAGTKYSLSCVRRRS